MPLGLSQRTPNRRTKENDKNMSSNKGKVLVLGATGLAGQAMVHAAKNRGYLVAEAARHRSQLTCDITDEISLWRILADEEPDLVVNCAAIVDIEACELNPWLGWRTNARPLSFLASWSKATGKQLLQISTDHYFPNDSVRPHDENASITFVNEYARQKYAGEAFALTAPKSLVLRTSIVGLRKWETPTFAEWAIDIVEHDRPAILFSDAYTSSIDATSFADATFNLLERDATGVLNVAASEVYSKEAFILEIASQLGRSMTNAQKGSISSLSVKRANYLGLDVSRAEALLGYHLPRLHDVVGALVRQHRKFSK